MPLGIVFDLEGVLIDELPPGNAHPEFMEVLLRARYDFDSTTLWTMAGMEQGTAGLVEFLDVGSVLTLFDRIILGIINHETMEHHFEYADLEQGRLVRTGKIYSFVGDNVRKNLGELGNPKDYVLIEDNKYGFPDERVVRMPSWPANNDPLSLSKAYEQALQKF